MQQLKAHYKFIALLSLAILLAACAPQTAQTVETETEADTVAETEPETETETEPEAPAAPAVEEAAPDTPELDGRTEFTGFGFSIAHPASWFVAAQSPVTIISEKEEDHEQALQDEQSQSAGYGISLDHRDMAFMRTIELPDDASLQDLYEMNRGFFDWSESAQPAETDAFGVPALAVTTAEAENWTYSLMGFVDDEAFLLAFMAPTEEALEAYRPTWDRMLASIEPAAP